MNSGNIYLNLCYEKDSLYVRINPVNIIKFFPGI